MKSWQVLRPPHAPTLPLLELGRAGRLARMKQQWELSQAHIAPITQALP